MDTLTPPERSERMSRIGPKDTKPEMAVRRLTHAMGYRYRLHNSDLPGKPDLVFPSKRKVIFVHGCFWHRHPGCGRMPKSRLSFWRHKLERNRKRDISTQRKLKRLGWDFLIVWECQLRDKESLARRIQAFLETGHEVN